jgi:hypothetical protein
MAPSSHHVSENQLPMWPSTPDHCKLPTVWRPDCRRDITKTLTTRAYNAEPTSAGFGMRAQRCGFCLGWAVAENNQLQG